VYTCDDLLTKDPSQIKLLSKVSGIYALINRVNGKQYIGSAVYFYRRKEEHLKGNHSNLPLQLAI
jgi:hypothetical protein